MKLLNDLERARSIPANIEAIEAEIKAYSRAFDASERETARNRWKRLKKALESEIDRNRQEMAAYTAYIEEIQDAEIKEMLQLHLNGVPWAKIHRIIYGYFNGGTGADYCYHKVTRYLKRHPMKRKDSFMNYAEVKEQNQQQFNSFPMGFAFTREQLAQQMQRLGVDSEADLISIGGGGFIRATDKAAFLAMLEETQERLQKEIDADPDGMGFVKQMFYTELANHEYCLTNDLTDTLEAVGYTAEEVNGNEKLRAGLMAAIDAYKAAGFE